MLEPGKVLGPFLIEEELGSGAMGMVYRAKYSETNQAVAIKVIAIGLAANETALARFEREAEILKQLKHPNIVRLFATGRYKKTPFFAMEFVEGESVDKVLERRGRLPWEEVVAMGKQLCKALKHAHAKGIIHRDLKPSNLMMLPNGVLKLTDFGIAKDSDLTALTGANCTVGTAAYMSPEQCKGERTLTNKSDLYSLGVVFYELLTGEKPFKKDSPVDMFMAHVNEPFERPSRLVLDIPPWLDTLVCQLMEKKPEHRPFDAEMVAKVLDEVESKMAEQHSAGLDMAKARRADRSSPIPADSADREAARALRSGTRRKRVRTKPLAFYEKPSFLRVSIPVLLVALGGLAWWMTRPPSAESFYRRANAAMNANDAETALAAVHDYFENHPNRTDANSREMRGWLEDLETAKLDRQMHNRFRRSLTPDGDEQQLVYSAIRSEDAGDFDAARKSWAELATRFENSPKVEEQAWAWLARRKIKTIAELSALEKKLPDVWEKPDQSPKSDAERKAAEAFRFERFGDYASGLDRWAKFKDDFIKDFEARNYVLLATAKVRDLKSKAPSDSTKIRAERIAVIKHRLSEVDSLSKEPVPANVRVARSYCKDVVDLYSKDAEKDPELADLVKSANAKLQSLPKSS